MSQATQSPAANAPVTTVRQKVLLIAFGLALFCLGLALVEGVMALFGLGDEYLYEDPFVGFAPGKELFERKTLTDGEEVYATRAEKLAFFNHQQFPVEKGPNTYRIFTLGGSTTAGRPYDDKVAFCRWLGLYLNELDPTRRWEAINAGAISYASYRVVLTMKELVRYRPDLFVVYTGHNEFLEERSYSDIIHQNPLLKKVRFWLNTKRFFVTARHAWLGLREPAADEGATLEGEVRARLDGWTGLELYHKDDELRRSVIEHFAYNLRQMVRVARDHDVDLVFVEPVSNLKDFSPFKSEHSASISSTDAARFASRLSEGQERLAAGEPGTALESFAAARELDPEHAGLHYSIGRAHFAANDYDAAADAFVRAKDLDVAPLRALERTRELIREIAAEEDLPRIGLPALLEADSRERFGHPILGNEYLLDHVHPDIATHSLIAEKVIEILVGQGVARPNTEWSEAKRQAIYDRLVASIDRTYHAERDLNLAKVLGWAGKLTEAEAPLRRAAAVLRGNAEVHLHLGIVYQKADQLDEAAEELRKALAIDPDSAEAHFNLGVVYGRLGRLQEGIAALEAALGLRSDYLEAHYNRGVLLNRQGAFGEATQALERARELDLDAAEIHGQLAQAYRGLGRIDDAIRAFERGLELAPTNAAIRTALGVTFGRQGRLEDAVRELQQAISDEPSAAEAHYNLGVVYSQQNDDEAAESAFLETVRLAPNHFEAHNNLGILYASRGELEDARRHLLQSIETAPTYADAYFNLGVVFDSAGQPQEASQLLARAVALEPENPRFHFALAMMHYALGELESAREHFAIARQGGVATPPEILHQLGIAATP
ncbi:MAG: tetratricopeptide repeat protein [Acidobacteriota bacterium]